MSASWWSAVTAWRSFSFHLLFNQLQLIDEREDVLKEKWSGCYDSFSKRKKKKDDRAQRKGKGIRSIISLLFLFWKGIISRLLEWKLMSAHAWFSFSREIFLVSISWLGQRPLLRASQRTQESQHNKRKRRKQTFDRISDRLFSFFF